MESKSDTGMHGEEFKEGRFDPDEMTAESQTPHVQQNGKLFLKCHQSSDVDIKIEIKQEIWDPYVASSDIKSSSNQTSTCQGTCAMKDDDEIDIKEEHIQDEVSAESQGHEIHFMEYNMSGHVETNAGIKQVAWDANGVLSDIRYDPEQPPILDLVPFLGTGPLKAGDKVDNKEELWCCEETSAESLNERKNKKANLQRELRDQNNPFTLPNRTFKAFFRFPKAAAFDLIEELTPYLQPSVRSTATPFVLKQSGSNEKEAAENLAYLEILSPNTDAVYSSSATQLQENKNNDSLSSRTSKSTHKCETKHVCTTGGKTFKLLSHLKKHNLVAKESNRRDCDTNCKYLGDLKDPLIHNSRRQFMWDFKGKSVSKLKNLGSLLVHDIKRQYKCMICEKTFKHLPDLQSHLLVHGDQRNYKCEVCAISFKSLGDFKKHLLVHDNKRKYKCKICEKSFKLSSHLKAHHLVHDDKRQYKCKKCEKSFKRLSELKSHLLVHDDKRPYQCQICNKGFNHTSNLKAHLLVHEDKRKYKCEICEKSFKWLRGLKAHHMVHERQYKCKICEKRFNWLRSLKEHLMVHDDKRQLKCEVCAKSFKWLGDLKKHLLVHDNKRQYKCQICEKSFKLSRHLKAHLLVHDDKRNYKCEICEKTFKWLRGLKEHHMIHANKRKHKCQICEKSFNLSSHLKAHLLVHDDKRQFNCVICEKSFKQLRSLKIHVFEHSDKSQVVFNW